MLKVCFIAMIVLVVGCGDQSQGPVKNATPQENNSKENNSKANNLPNPEEQAECGRFVGYSEDAEILRIVASTAVMVDNDEVDPYIDLFECPLDESCDSPPKRKTIGSRCTGVMLHPQWLLTKSSCLPTARTPGAELNVKSSNINHDGDYQVIEQDKFALIRLQEPVKYKGYFFGARLMQSELPEDASLVSTHLVVSSGMYQRSDKLKRGAANTIQPKQQTSCDHQTSVTSYAPATESPVVVGFAQSGSEVYDLISPHIPWIVETLKAQGVDCTREPMMYSPELTYLKCF